jgi:hypothetical protein
MNKQFPHEIRLSRIATESTMTRTANLCNPHRIEKHSTWRSSPHLRLVWNAEHRIQPESMCDDAFNHWAFSISTSHNIRTSSPHPIGQCRRHHLNPSAPKFEMRFTTSAKIHRQRSSTSSITKTLAATITLLQIRTQHSFHTSDLLPVVAVCEHETTPGVHDVGDLRYWWLPSALLGNVNKRVRSFILLLSHEARQLSGLDRWCDMKGFARMEEEYDAHKENMMDAEKRWCRKYWTTAIRKVASEELNTLERGRSEVSALWRSGRLALRKFSTWRYASVALWFHGRNTDLSSAIAREGTMRLMPSSEQVSYRHTTVPSHMPRSRNLEILRRWQLSQGTCRPLPACEADRESFVPSTWRYLVHISRAKMVNLWRPHRWWASPALLQVEDKSTVRTTTDRQLPLLGYAILGWHSSLALAVTCIT